MLECMDRIESDRPAARESVRTMFPALYGDLRRLARSRLASGGRHTLLDTSSLVHEAFLRMQRGGGVTLENRDHFMAYAATTMRSVVIDFVRRRNAERRGGDVEHVTLDTRAAEQLGASDDEILAVHNALDTLAKVDARLVRVVEMRYFAGLSELEIAAALGVTDRTVRRDWNRARLLLADMLGR
jgi:RNA polymerase sigma factor (TIGR02999 family)